MKLAQLSKRYKKDAEALRDDVVKQYIWHHFWNLANAPCPNDDFMKSVMEIELSKNHRFSNYKEPVCFYPELKYLPERDAKRFNELRATFVAEYEKYALTDKYAYEYGHVDVENIDSAITFVDLCIKVRRADLPDYLRSIGVVDHFVYGHFSIQNKYLGPDVMAILYRMRIIVLPLPLELQLIIDRFLH